MLNESPAQRIAGLVRLPRRIVRSITSSMLGSAKLSMPRITLRVGFIARAEAKGLLTEARSQAFVVLLQRLNIATDPSTAGHALGDTLHLARRYKLSAYDAAYLELALRTGLPLATLDADLKKAAQAAGVEAFAPN